MSFDRERHGNRVWRVDTPAGPALQKVYRRRGGVVQGLGTWLLSSLLGLKSSPLPGGRRQAEREALALWREAGIDVPRDLTDEVSGFGAENVLLIEFVPGEALLDLLRPERLSAEARADLLARFAGDWGRRHRIALERHEPRLVHEHGSFEHVILSGERMVTIDLERIYRSGDPRRLIAKEIVSLLRSLAKRSKKGSFIADLRVIVDAYPDHDLLRWLVAEYGHSQSLWRRVLWRVDRALRRKRGGRGRAKYAVVDRLATVLAEIDRDGPPGRGGPAAAPSAEVGSRRSVK